MVRRIRPDGFISMQMLGYWLTAALPDQRWVILGSKGPVLAVTDIWDAHIAPHDASGHTAQQDLYLDTGARSAADVAALAFLPVILWLPYLISRCSRTIAIWPRPGTIASVARLCWK
jgi:endoglucanase